MLPAVFGLVGVILGISINELLRRKSRIEHFTKEVFIKRLEIFEELYQLIVEVERVSYELLEESNKEIVNTIWTDTIHKLAGFLDKNFIYINEEISVQCMIPLMGYDDSLFSDKKEELVYQFRRSMKETKLLIRNASGISAVEESFRSVAKIKLNTDSIRYFLSLKRDHEKREKKNKI